MENQKLDNQLNLALSATKEERNESFDLNVGYNEENNSWDLIVKYDGTPAALEEDGMILQPLLGGYAIVTLPERKIDAFSRKEQVTYIEKPKGLHFQTAQGVQSSCVRPVRNPPYNLSGKGTLIGVVDSGVDYRHPDFCMENGKTRILKLWDQSERAGKPPQGYRIGAEYTKEQIDRALELPKEAGERIVPERDLSGHGTQVLGIAAGNGNASNGELRGMAYESELLVVKMKQAQENGFPRSIELMLGVDYLVRQAIEMGKPIAINLSFGNNYGSHEGNTLLERYLDNVSNLGKNSICVGTGNNAALPLHESVIVKSGEKNNLQLSVGKYESKLNVQIWKSYADEVWISLESPSGERIGPFPEKIGTFRYQMGMTELLIYYGKPAPYMISQEIYIDFLPKRNYVDEGIWRIILEGREIKSGICDLWLPGGGVLNQGTGFAYPVPEMTMTIPSAASRVVAVGAYNSRRDSYADFSGRGVENELRNVKPDLVAPGVDIETTFPGGGYGTVTGTSFATPFVTGAAALLMQWGIADGNDHYLYGEKIKAYLQKGASRMPGFTQYPNPEIGYGTLCVANSIPK